MYGADKDDLTKMPVFNFSGRYIYILGQTEKNVFPVIIVIHLEKYKPVLQACLELKWMCIYSITNSCVAVLFVYFFPMREHGAK